MRFLSYEGRKKIMVYEQNIEKKKYNILCIIRSVSASEVCQRQLMPFGLAVPRTDARSLLQKLLNFVFIFPIDDYCRHW